MQFKSINPGAQQSCERGDTGLVVVVGNAGEDGDEDVGSEDHHGALGQAQECLHPRQRRKLNTLVWREGKEGGRFSSM